MDNRRLKRAIPGPVQPSRIPARPRSRGRDRPILSSALTGDIRASYRPVLNDATSTTPARGSVGASVARRRVLAQPGVAFLATNV